MAKEVFITIQGTFDDEIAEWMQREQDLHKEDEVNRTSVEKEVMKTFMNNATTPSIERVEVFDT